MECRTISGSHVLMWELDRPASSSRVAIFRNHDGKPRLIPPFSSRFGFDMDESCSGLLYTNTTRLDDAGRYICRIDGENGEDEFSAYLTVLGKNKLCIEVRHCGLFGKFHSVNSVSNLANAGSKPLRGLKTQESDLLNIRTLQRDFLSHK